MLTMGLAPMSPKSRLLLLECELRRTLEEDSEDMFEPFRLGEMEGRLGMPGPIHRTSFWGLPPFTGDESPVAISVTKRLWPAAARVGGNEEHATRSGPERART